MSERELARRFGVSSVTVARVLRDLQAAGLVARIQGKGTFLQQPPVAENLCSRSAASPSAAAPVVSRRVLILSSLAAIDDDTPVSQLWDYLAATGAERALQGYGHETHTVDVTGTYPGGVAAEVGEIAARGLDGIVVIGTVDSLARRCVFAEVSSDTREPISAVHVIWDQPNCLPLDSVGFDGEHGVYLATRHLIQYGHTDIRYLAPGWFDRRNLPFWLRDRLRGFYRALEEARIEDIAPDDVMWGDIDYRRVEFGDKLPSGVDRWRFTGQGLWRRLREGVVPDAVVAVNDQVARAFVEAARTDGASIPGDISVAGFDDRHDSAAFGLTTVHVPVQEIGGAAAEFLLQRIANPSPTRRERVSILPTLVSRRTTGGKRA